MKKLSAFLLSAAFMAILLAGCGKEEKTIVGVKGYKDYKDNLVDFSIKYPSNWYLQKYPGFRVIAYTSREAAARFRSYESIGVPGAKMEMYAIELKEGLTVDSVKKMKFFEDRIYSAPQPVTVDGIQGEKQTYKFELNDGIVEGEIYYFAKDTHFVTIIDFEAFQSDFDAYRKNFSEILQSAKMAMLPTKTRKDSTVIQELPPPSATLVQYHGDGFNLLVSDNFAAKNPSVAGAMKSYNFIGERRADGNIQVDIFDASKQNNLDKIVETNKGKYRGANPSATNIGGKKAYVFEYMPIAKVKSRVYFAVSNNRLYRITVNWPVEEEQNYKPIFDRSIGSLKIQ